MQRWCKVGMLLVLLLASWATRSMALSAVPRTFDELVLLAEQVLVGTVTQSASAVGEGEKIYTYVTLADLQILKGEVPGDTYVVRFSGGFVGTRGEVYGGLPQLEVGSRYLLFVRGNFRDLFPMVGVDQGLFKVEWDAGQQQEVIRSQREQPAPAARTSALGSAAGDEGFRPEAGTTLAQFMARIRARLDTATQGGHVR